MATSSLEPTIKYVKLRSRALALVRRFGRHQSRSRVTSQRNLADTRNTRPPIHLSRQRSFSGQKSFVDSNGPRPMVRITSKRSFSDSKSGVKVVARSKSGNVKINTQSRTRKGIRKHRELCKGQHCVKRLSNTRFHLDLDGLEVTTQSNEPVELNVDISSVGACVASYDSGFDFICASPVSCPPPLGLVPARQSYTVLQLHPRDGTDKLTYDNNNKGFSSTGFKRKMLSTSSPSYTPTPPSPFLNDLILSQTSNTRARSRVSVGCNGWIQSDDDPSIAGWHQRCSDVKPTPIITKLPQVNEGNQESEADFVSPKRYKKTPQASNNSGGFGDGNMTEVSVDEIADEKLDAVKERTSFTARFSASLRLTRSHSPRMKKGTLSPGNRRRKDQRSTSHNSLSRSMFRIGSKNGLSKSAPPAVSAMTSSPSIFFIDCPP